MSDAPPGSPSLDDLGPLVERTLRTERHRFRRRWRDLQQARYAFILNSFRLRAAAGTLTEADLELASHALARG